MSLEGVVWSWKTKKKPASEPWSREPVTDQEGEEMELGGREGAADGATWGQGFAIQKSVWKNRGYFNF